MSDLPTIHKTVSHLDQKETLHENTIKLLSGIILSAGIVLGANTVTDASPAGQSFSMPKTFQESPIVLTPATKQMAGAAFTAQHYSHRSHMSHSSHRSHYSSRY